MRAGGQARLRLERDPQIPARKRLLYFYCVTALPCASPVRLASDRKGTTNNTTAYTSGPWLTLCADRLLEGTQCRTDGGDEDAGHTGGAA